MNYVARILFFMIMVQSAFSQINMRFRAHIPPHASTLGDLVLISPPHEKMANLSLESHPQAGQILDKNTILKWIHQKSSEQQVRWLGKTTIRIGCNIKTKGERLAKMAEKALIHRLSNASFHHIQLKRLNAVSDSEQTLDCFKTVIHLRKPLAKKIGVWLYGKNEKHLVWFQVKARKEAWIAKRSIKANEVLSLKDFERQSINIAGSYGFPVDKIPQDYWLTHSINAHDVLLEKYIAPLPQIIQGESVKVLIRKPGLNIYMQALAEHSGYLGEMIKLKNIKSDKSFYAYVTGIKQVEIRL
ncbi:flagellar basal body P-ring formation protein FlgA [Legionella israelensis]|nr:flagellar basal body P-ring formation protein FlgA [Legionella israelensis]